MSNFSKFLNGIYNLRLSLIKNRSDFLTGVFMAAGRETKIYLSDEAIKSICNGNRNLSDELRSQFPSSPCTNKEKEYFMSTLNKNRILDFFEEFGISKEEKQNYETICLAIAMQFENFMKYGDIVSTTVKSLYEYLLDQDLPKDLDNNEDAVFSAKTMFLNTLREFSKIDKNKSLIDSRDQLDNVFQNIFNSFKAFEKRCNHIGLEIYKTIREEIIYKNNKLNNYVKMASEPGSLPLPLEKGVSVIVYDNVHYDDQKIIFKLDDKAVVGFNNTAKAIHELCSKKDLEYVFFTEIYAYYLKGDKTNLLPSLFDSLTFLNRFWNKIEDSLGGSERIKLLNKKIKEEMLACRKTGFSYYYDGTYYPKDKRIAYDMMIEDVIYDKSGCTTYTEDSPIPFEQNPVIRGDTFEERFRNYLERIIEAARGCHGLVSTECLLLTEDNYVRWFVTLSKSRATITRKIRKMANLAYYHKGKSFFWASKNFGCEIEQNNRFYLDKLSPEEYSKTEFICIYACENDRILSFCVRTKDIFSDEMYNIKITNDPFMVFLDPIWIAIRNKKNG